MESGRQVDPDPAPGRIEGSCMEYAARRAGCAMKK
jgi:hypothetical protein